MQSVTTWWRGLGGVLAALVLAMFALAPALDAATCGAEGVAAVSAAPSAHSATASPALALHADDHAGASQDTDDGGVCGHGHCHHGGTARPALDALVAMTPSASQRPVVPQPPVPVADPRYGLDRPPRV